MEWRTFRDRDLPEVAALLEDALPHDRPAPAHTRYLLLDDPGFDPDLVWVAEDGGRIAGVVAGVLPDERLQSPGGIKLFAVHASYRRQGVATRLFDAVEEALRRRGVTQCVAINCGNHRLSLGLDVRYTAALCLLWGRGYERTGTTQDMAVPLVGPAAVALETEIEEARLRVHGVVFRRAAPAERDWVVEGVAREMIPPTPSRRWAYLAEQAFRHQPPAIEIAEETRDHAFLGFAAYDAGRWGMLGPMGVAASARHLGVGTVLLKRCLRDLRAAGHSQGEILSVGPIPFYAKTVDAHIFRVFYQYAKPLS